MRLMPAFSAQAKLPKLCITPLGMPGGARGVDQRRQLVAVAHRLAGQRLVRAHDGVPALGCRSSAGDSG
jgi:hypothetical protein